MKKKMIEFIMIIIGIFVFAVEISLPDGSIYYGSLKDKLFSGKAIQIWPNGDKYEGEYENGLFHGYGEMTTNTYIYKGDFFKGEQTGKAVINYIEGSYYEGEVLAGQYEGYGKLETSTGDIFEGTFKNSLLNGKGKKIYADGSKCSGNFVNTKLEGHGVYKYANGDYYIGNFSNGEFDGYGTLTKKNGKVYKGEFSHGKLPYKYILKSKINSIISDTSIILLLISFIVNIIIYNKIKKRKNSTLSFSQNELRPYVKNKQKEGR